MAPWLIALTGVIYLVVAADLAYHQRLGDGDGEHWVSDGPAPPLFWMPLPAPPTDAK